jgi:hypothetical protein
MYEIWECYDGVPQTRLKVFNTLEAAIYMVVHAKLGNLEIVKDGRFITWSA